MITYFRAPPPGYSSTAENGEEGILELFKAINDLKKASSCFWTAVNKKNISRGLVSGMFLVVPVSFAMDGRMAGRLMMLRMECHILRLLVRF